MQTFSLFIQDQRYSVATLQFVDASDIERVKTLARRELLASPYHLAVEVHDAEGAPCHIEQRRP